MLMYLQRLLITCRVLFLPLLLLSSFPAVGTAGASAQVHAAVRQIGQKHPARATDCPTPGTARAAVLLPRAGRSPQSIIYFTTEEPVQTEPGNARVYRYTVAGGRNTLIAPFPKTFLNEAQVSPDGQWLLFVTQSASRQSQISVMRVDGRYLQTLTCQSAPGGISSVQWSPDQQLVVFLTQAGQQGNHVSLLHLHTGKLETLLAMPPQTLLSPRVWLDNTRVYLEDDSQPALPTTLYLLDTHKGTGQRQGDVLSVINDVQHPFSSYDSSPDGTQLFVSRCGCSSSGLRQGPSTLSMQRAIGGGAVRQVYFTPAAAIVTVRVITSTTLLLVLERDRLSGGAPQSRSEVGKFSLVDHRLTLLAKAGAHEHSQLNVFSQYSGSNVSRDGSSYVVELASTLKPPQARLLYGALSGGPLTPFAAVSGGSQMYMVGWTPG